MSAFEGFKSGLATAVMILLSSIFLIILGLIYFLVTLWIVNFGAEILDLDPHASFVVLSAALITMGVTLGSSLAKKY